MADSDATTFPRGLLDIPYEIILEMAEVGDLDAISRLALRHTCKRFFQFAGQHAFWVSAAQMLVQKGYALSLPLFHSSLKALSTEQLIVACCRCHRRNVNLESPHPKYRRHYTLSFEPGFTKVENFAFLQGGRFAMSTHYDGSIQVWDLEPPHDQCEVPNDPTQIGRSLGCHIIGENVIAIGYQCSGSPSKTSILVAAACCDPMNGHTSLYSFTIDFELGPDNQCGVCFSPDYSIIDLEALPSPGVIAQDGLAISLLRPLFRQETLLVIVDHFRRAHITVATGLDRQKAWDVVLSGEDVLLFSESLDEVTYAAYFGLRALLPTNGSLDIEKSPSVIRTHRYNVTKISGLGEMHWYAVHPWDTPHWQTDGLVPVFFEATPPEQQPESDVQCRSVVGMHWFSPSQIIESLKSGGTLPDGSRQIKYLSNECVLSAIDEASTLVPSTYGRKLLWVNVPSEPDQPQSEDVRLEMISIRTPWHTDVSEHASGIQYNLPINLGLVHRVDFDDENGKLLVIVCSEDEEDTRYIAHIFVY